MAYPAILMRWANDEASMGAKPLIISQRQVTAVLKAAAALGVQMEIRIEGDAVRFIPLAAEEEPIDRHMPKGKRTRLHL